MVACAHELAGLRLTVAPAVRLARPLRSRIFNAQCLASVRDRHLPRPSHMWPQREPRPSSETRRSAQSFSCRPPPLAPDYSAARAGTVIGPTARPSSTASSRSRVALGRR